jgi:hypothetical protein
VSPAILHKSAVPARRSDANDADESHRPPNGPRSERVIHMYETKIRNTIFVMSSKACKSEQKASLLGTSDPELKERTHA